ncbi:DNA polymerase III subunit alpha [Patescibacteria group bacterium]
MSKFVHLHVHSHYSLLDGLPKIPELIERAKNEKMSALALTDHGVMYGAVEFYREATKAGIKPIIGVETYVARNGRHNKRPRMDDRPYHLVLLARNNTGYENLIKLISLAHLEGFYYKPRIDLELLKKYGEGLIGLSACLAGHIPQLILSRDTEGAKTAIRTYQEIFGKEYFYLELQSHPRIADQMVVNEGLKELSKELDVPLVATNDVHYVDKDDAEAQDILLCIQTKKHVEDKDRMSYTGENFSFKSEGEMKEAFFDNPEAVANTQKIADACKVQLEFEQMLLPYFKVPNGKSPDEYLRELCEKGLAYRYPESTNDPEILKRLEYELSVIQRMGFSDYFLIVQDVVNWAKSNGIVVGPGRGSAAGSLVSYLLNITNIDPLKYDLMFERFLNPDRISMPDIDLDFADIRRDEVIRYVENKYGKEHVAQIITFGTMAARAAVRDVGRVLSLPYTYCDRVAKLIPMFTSLDKALATIPELKDIYENDPDGRKLLESAKRLEGVARHTSTHACGVVITKQPLTQYTPLQYASQGDNIIVTQYSLHPIEDLGLLKMDFLGLKNLTILENTLEIIKKARGVSINIDDIPLDDAKTFALLQKGKSIGVFQLESRGMQRYLIQLKPSELEDIIAMVALFRPGPMDLIPQYIAGKHGLKKPIYLHPKLMPILEKTYGIAVYQEQVMQIARDLAGFTLSEADVLRKAVGKKIFSLLIEQREKMISGMTKNNIPKATAEKIWKFIEPFARYGFNRAHAACYALIAYQTAYFKANYPEEFMASLMTSEHGDVDRIAIEVEECKRLGIVVLPPDVNESFITFTAVFNTKTKLPIKKIRFGLSAIKNVGDNVVSFIVHERKKNGQYTSLEDFLRRIRTKDLNRKSLDSLIKSGALDGFGERNQMISNLDMMLSLAKTAEQESLSGQKNLFGMLPVENTPELRLRATSPAPKKLMLAWEKDLLGLYISDHPLAEYREVIEKSSATPIMDLSQHVNRTITIIGIVSQLQKVMTRTNEPMLFVRFEDLTGRIEAIVFPSTLKENPNVWQQDAIVKISGRVSDRDGVTKVLVSKATKFDPQESSTEKTNQNTSSTYLISIPEGKNGDHLEKLKTILSRFPGSQRVHIKIVSNGETKIIATKFSITPSEAFKASVHDLLYS